MPLNHFARHFPRLRGLRAMSEPCSTAVTVFAAPAAWWLRNLDATAITRSRTQPRHLSTRNAAPALIRTELTRSAFRCLGYQNATGRAGSWLYGTHHTNPSAVNHRPELPGLGHCNSESACRFAEVCELAADTSAALAIPLRQPRARLGQHLVAW